MKVTTSETLYHEDHGDTLKHKCGKKDSNIAPSLFSLIFWAFSHFLASFIHPESHSDLWGNHSLHHPFLTLDNALIMKIHHTFIFLQLKNYNSILRKKIWLYMIASGGVPGWAMNQEWHVWKIMHGGFATNMMSTTWSCKAIWQWRCVS